MEHKRVGFLLSGALLIGWLMGLLVAGCGSVSDVGYGASRAGVDPVRGTSAFGTSPYATADAEKQAERVRTIARANQQTEKKTTTLVSKAEALPDIEGPEVAEAELPAQPTLDPQTKSLVAQLDTEPSASREQLGATGPGEYEEY